jgi:signal transduction histidine kinase
MALAAVAFSSWYCGLWPSILCAATSLLGVEFWFVRPTHSLGAAQTAGWFGRFAFLFTAAVIVAIGEASRRHESRLRDAAGELEENVRQRTRELDSTNQSLRELTARLLNLQDEERRRIARELHDNAGQALAVLGINLSAVADDLGGLVSTIHKVKDSASLVHQMSDDIRTMSYLLHPPLLDEMGLLSALEWYVQGFAERSKIAVEFDCAQKFGRFSHDVEIAVFRVVQECLTNIHRHSGSPTAVVQITHSDGHLQVEVSDSREGIPADKREQMESGGTVGVGIRGMRERIQQLGGGLNIGSNGAGTGTRVVVRLPAAESASAQAASSEVALEFKVARTGQARP